MTACVLQGASGLFGFALVREHGRGCGARHARRLRAVCGSSGPPLLAVSADVAALHDWSEVLPGLGDALALTDTQDALEHALRTQTEWRELLTTGCDCASPGLFAGERHVLVFERDNERPLLRLPVRTERPAAEMVWLDHDHLGWRVGLGVDPRFEPIAELAGATPEGAHAATIVAGGFSAVIQDPAWPSLLGDPDGLLAAGALCVQAAVARDGLLFGEHRRASLEIGLIRQGRFRSATYGHLSASRIPAGVALVEAVRDLARGAR